MLCWIMESRWHWYSQKSHWKAWAICDEAPKRRRRSLISTSLWHFRCWCFTKMSPSFLYRKQYLWGWCERKSFEIAKRRNWRRCCLHPHAKNFSNCFAYIFVAWWHLSQRSCHIWTWDIWCILEVCNSFTKICQIGKVEKKRERDKILRVDGCLHIHYSWPQGKKKTIVICRNELHLTIISSMLQIFGFHTIVLESLNWHMQEQWESDYKWAMRILGADKGIFIKWRWRCCWICSFG